MLEEVGRLVCAVGIFVPGLEGSALGAIPAFVQMTFDADFVDRSIHRQKLRLRSWDLPLDVVLPVCRILAGFLLIFVFDWHWFGRIVSVVGALSLIRALDESFAHSVVQPRPPPITQGAKKPTRVSDVEWLIDRISVRAEDDSFEVASVEADARALVEALTQSTGYESSTKRALSLLVDIGRRDLVVELVERQDTPARVRALSRRLRG